MARYTYDAWGKVLSVTDANGNANTSSTFIGNVNPIRYRGYYYDKETGWYYLNSRYYDPEVKRFINADSEISGANDQITGKNLFAYCFNNPVMLTDETGSWPKWATGILNVVSGIGQAIGGALLIAAAPVSGGLSAVAGSVLLVNGAATVSQGTGQIVNDLTESNIMREDNIVKSGVQTVGEVIAGETGAQVAGAAYDVTVAAANVYAPATVATRGLQQAGVIPVNTPISKVLNNPIDPFTQGMPAQGVVSNYCRSIPLNGYGKISVTQLPNGYYQLANGHHRVAALKSLGYDTIKVFITK